MDRKISRLRNGLQLDGRAETINSVAVTVYTQDLSENVLLCSGATVPTADSVGFAKGCLFIKTDAADGTKGLYENVGTTLLSDFNLIGDISTAEIADGAITPVKSAQAEAVIATSDGLTTGIVSDTARHISISSAGANNIVVLPTPVVGKVITGYIGATGCEVRTDASGDKINDVDCGDASNEAAIPATSMVKFTCISATEWILEATTELGAVVTAIIPDAV